MEPNKFRESRQAINRLCKNINILIEQKDLEASKEGYQEVSSKLDTLTPHAEGEIQKRSVRNLEIKIKSLSNYIGKLKPKKKPGGKPRGTTAKPAIVWDEERLGQLSPLFLGKVFANMGDDKDAQVCFGTTGKGIRPSYQIEFGNKDKTTFSGSGHTPVGKSLSTAAKKTVQSFSYEVIDSILNKK